MWIKISSFASALRTMTQDRWMCTYTNCSTGVLLTVVVLSRVASDQSGVEKLLRLVHMRFGVFFGAFSKGDHCPRPNDDRAPKQSPRKQSASTKRIYGVCPRDPLFRSVIAGEKFRY